MIMWVGCTTVHTCRMASSFLHYSLLLPFLPHFSSSFPYPHLHFQDISSVLALGNPCFWFLTAELTYTSGHASSISYLFDASVVIGPNQPPRRLTALLVSHLWRKTGSVLGPVFLFPQGIKQQCSWFCCMCVYIVPENSLWYHHVWQLFWYSFS